MNSCSVEERRRELRATMPCSTTGCCGMSTSMRPIVTRAELWSFVFLLTDEYSPCDFPTFTVTTVLQQIQNFVARHRTRSGLFTRKR